MRFLRLCYFEHHFVWSHQRLFCWYKA